MKARHRRDDGETEARYDLFLNPHAGMAFTTCPRCRAKTKVRKFCLFIHVEPELFMSFNKSCRFCPGCELLLGHQDEREAYLVAVCAEQGRPDLIGNRYEVVGTHDRAFHRRGRKQGGTPAEAVDSVRLFRNRIDVDVTPGGWRPANG